MTASGASSSIRRSVLRDRFSCHQAARVQVLVQATPVAVYLAETCGLMARTRNYLPSISNEWSKRPRAEPSLVTIPFLTYVVQLLVLNEFPYDDARTSYS
jgi:hypothetical protein